ncbi:MAG: tetratricopeptide repeat protein [Candidatus Limimorpha sp.]
MKTKKYIFIIAMLTCMVAEAQNIQEQSFSHANDYYNESRYDTALIIYKSIVDDGYVSAPLFYNIGNTYFKLRNYPMAILNYEKALKLDPTNEEIKENLSIANALITDKIEPLPVFFMTKVWNNISDKLTADRWAITSLILLALTMLSIFLYLTTRKTGIKKATFFTNIVFAILFVCAIVFSYQKYTYINTHDEAIIITPTITVKSSPSSSGVDLFVLHEGTKVSIMDSERDWDKIKIADGSIGWIPSSTSIKY